MFSTFDENKHYVVLSYTETHFHVSVHLTYATVFIKSVFLIERWQK